MNSERIQHARRPDLKLDKPAGRRGTAPLDRRKNLLNCGRLLASACILVLLWPSVVLAETSGGPDLSIEVVGETEGVPAGATARMAVLVTIPEGWHINAHKPREDYLIPTELDILPAEGFAVGPRVYPEPSEHALQGAETPLLVYSGTFPIGFTIHAAASLAPGRYVLKAALQYQACNDTQCWMPTSLDIEMPVEVLSPDAVPAVLRPDLFASIPFEKAHETAPAEPPAPGPEPASDADLSQWEGLAEGFRVTGRNSGYMSARAFLQWLDDVEWGKASSSLNRFAGVNVWLIAVMTLLGGLALNLTPCVLPLIPINLAVIGAGAQAQSRRRGFLLGAAYGAAIALVYGLLGVVAATLGTAFGAVNASPWFNFAVAIVFGVMVLALFDVINIDFSGYRAGIQARKKPGGSFVAAFLMGGIAALLAGACVGPVVISVVLFAQDLYAKGVYIGLGLPFLLGLGMALPWPFAGAGVALLPKPGAWMVRVKQIMGAMIFLLAAYYAYEGVRLFNDRYLVDEDAVRAGVAELDADGWTHSLVAGLERARIEQKPIFIDFWATWCKNCLTMNQTTFKNPEVQERLSAYVKVKFQAQFLDRSPTKEIMEQFGVGGLGLPVYVIAQPPG